jgi:hypothetical protein
MIPPKIVAPNVVRGPVTIVMACHIVIVVVRASVRVVCFIIVMYAAAIIVDDILIAVICHVPIRMGFLWVIFPPPRAVPHLLLQVVPIGMRAIPPRRHFAVDTVRITVGWRMATIHSLMLLYLHNVGGEVERGSGGRGLRPGRRNRPLCNIAGRGLGPGRRNRPLCNVTGRGLGRGSWNSMHDIAERSGRHIAEFSCTSQFEGSVSR